MKYRIIFVKDDGSACDRAMGEMEDLGYEPISVGYDGGWKGVAILFKKVK